MRITMNRQTFNYEELFHMFITHCKVKNLSKATLKYYYECWNEYTRFSEQIDKENINQYTLYLQSRYPTDTTVANRLRGLRAILYYLMEENHIDEFKIKIPKVEKKIKKTYTDEEIGVLLKMPNVKKCEFFEYRNWVIVNFFLGTGCRASTVINLRIEDLDFRSGYITLRHMKNRKQHIIPLNATLSNVLREYLGYRRGEDTDYLFCNEWGKPLTVNALGNGMRKYNRKRGVTTTGLHTFRHTFAKNYISRGGDVFRLQSILGHASLDMTREYVNLFKEDLKDNFDDFTVLEPTRKKMKLVK